MAASRRCGLTEAQKGRFSQMLINLEPGRANIGDLMVWCLEHADSAADITQCISESFVPGTPLYRSKVLEESRTDEDGNEMPEPIKEDESPDNCFELPVSKVVARIFLISDILYNSSARVPNASYFRKW